MTKELKLALGLSVSLHVGVFVGLPITSPVEFDVERAPTSLEVYLVAPPKTVLAFRQQIDQPSEPIPERAALVPEEPVPQTLIAPEHRGAISEVLPNYFRNPPPIYPRLAREQGYEGTVLLEVQVLPSGHGGHITVLESSGHAVLDEAALKAVQQWQFRPARRGRMPVAVSVEIPITFRLINWRAR